MVELLQMNKGLDINITDKVGVNAFWVACIFGHDHIMKNLAENGIDVLCKN